MAENETLSVDGRTASRWEPVRQRISSGDPPSDCFIDIEDQFYRGLRRACRNIAQRGVPLERLLTTAVTSPGDLEALVRQTRCQEHAKVLLDIVRSQAFLSLEQLVAAWLWSVWDSIRDLLQLDLNGHAPDAPFDERIRAMIHRVALLIARNPSRIPNRPRRSDDQSPGDLDDKLGRSIL